MEIKIQVTEEEIEQRKKEWIDAQLHQYSKMEYWKRQNVENELLAEIRKQQGYGSEMYLTAEFKKELQDKYREQVRKLVDEELKRLNYNLKKMVQDFIFEKLDNLVQETLKDSIFVSQVDYERQFETEQ
jgi:uncharacterized membrane protein YheB (UPF0754 family)